MRHLPAVEELAEVEARVPLPLQTTDEAFVRL